MTYQTDNILLHFRAIGNHVYKMLHTADQTHYILYYRHDNGLEQCHHFVDEVKQDKWQLEQNETSDS